MPNPGRCHPPPPPPPPVVFPPEVITGFFTFQADGMCLFDVLHMEFAMPLPAGEGPVLAYFASGAGGAGWWDVRLNLRIAAPFNFDFQCTTGMIWWCGWADRLAVPFDPELPVDQDFPPWRLVAPAGIAPVANVSW